MKSIFAAKLLRELSTYEANNSLKLSFTKNRVLKRVND